MKKRESMDQNRIGDALIIAGLARLVEEDGFTPHEALGILRDIGEKTFFALGDLHKEYREAKK
jgi:hypothetical protein